jgi:glycogen debranching enzyme
MAEALLALDGSTFFVSSPSGDVEPGADASGYFSADMRHLSTWQLLADGEPLKVLSSGAVDYYSASIHATLARARVGKNPRVTVRRDRFVSDGVHEDLIVTNNSSQPTRLELELRFGADFADLFEVKNPRPKRGTDSVQVSADRVTLSYRRDGFGRGTIVAFGAAGELTAERARFDIELVPRDSWRCCIEVSTVVDGKVFGPGHACAAFDRPRPKMPLRLDEWLDDAPRLRTGHDTLTHTYRQSLIDLAALRFRPSESVSWSLPAAGLPWFMALFGRDSLITSYQALPYQPRLALTTLEALAEMQATEFDDFRDAETGKILHELRCGELARMGEVPHTPYYGTHDATPLFLILQDEYERWTGDLELVGRLEPAARAALRWVQQYGDPDGDGYLEFRTRSPVGLINQGWKDSWNSSLFADNMFEVWGSAAATPTTRPSACH